MDWRERRKKALQESLVELELDLKHVKTRAGRHVIKAEIKWIKDELTHLEDLMKEG